MNLEYEPHPMAPQAPLAGPSATSEDEGEMVGTESLDAPAAPPRRPRLWLRSLTSRLVAGVVVLVIVIVAAIGGTTYYALDSFLFQRLDQQLAPVAQSNVKLVLCGLAANIGLPEPGCYGGGGGGASNAGGYRAAAVDEWIAVLDPSSTSLVVQGGPDLLRPMKLSPAQQRKYTAHPPGAETLTTTDGQELRVSARVIQFNGSQYVVISGLSTNEIHRTLRHLVFLELVIGLSGVVLAFLVTSWGVRRGLRNLYQVTGTAQEVAAELSPEGTGLDRRVPVAEPGTEVGQLAESMNTLLAAVETQFAARLESEQRMRQFLADASHELRTPLTSIRGYAELARMQRAAGDADADNLDRIESEGTRMSRLVDDLLLLARGDNDQIRVNPPELIDVGELIDDAVAGSRAAFPSRRIDIEVSPSPPILGDHDQLLRVIRNLITNAAVHTEAGRPILVRGFADQFAGQSGAVIAVADGGPGLPPEQAAHVFERFWRADKARTRARGGTGLGLSIVAAIAAAHGGSVHFDSSVESGSTVTLWLPAAVE